MNKTSSDFTTPQRLGRHILADFYRARHLTVPGPVEQLLSEAAETANATVLDLKLHDFGEGFGYTGFALLAESHISVHTWPEHGYVAIDIFMCGQSDAERALATLRKYFAPGEERIQILDRGQLPQMAEPETSV